MRCKNKVFFPSGAVLLRNLAHQRSKLKFPHIPVEESLMSLANNTYTPFFNDLYMKYSLTRHRIAVKRRFLLRNYMNTIYTDLFFLSSTQNFKNGSQLTNFKDLFQFFRYR